MKSKELEAIKLRYKGKDATEISKAINVSLPTVHSWFESKGRLYQAYNEYEQEQNALQKELDREAEVKIRDEAVSLMRKNLRNAVITVVKNLASVDEKVQLAAARELLDRVLGKPVQPTLTGSIGQDMIETWKKELGIDAANITDDHFREVDLVDVPKEALPLSEADSKKNTESISAGQEAGGSSGTTD